MQTAFDLACADLRLGPDRGYMRTHLGILMFEIASDGDIECGLLRRRSVRSFRKGQDLHPPDAVLVALPNLGRHRVRYRSGVRIG